MLLALRSLWEVNAESPPVTPPGVGGGVDLREYYRSKLARLRRKKKAEAPAPDAPPAPPPLLDVLVAGWSISPITPTIGEGFLVIGSVISAPGARVTPRVTAGVFNATCHLPRATCHPSPHIGYGKAIMLRPAPVDPREFTAEDLPALALIIAEL